MSKRKILIVEDNPDEAAYLQQTLSEFGYEIAGITNSLDQAYPLFTETRPAVCLVDIYLKNKPDGVAFARQLADAGERTPIVFLTGNYDSVTFYLAKTTSPHGYLLKPYNPLELQYAIELAVDKAKHAPLQESDTLFIKRGANMIRLDIDNIIYIEVEGKYSRIVCATERFLVQQSLKDLQLQLPARLFSRVHRNYLVNIDKVTKIDTLSNEVLFNDRTSLPLSRRYLNSLLDYFKVLK